MRCWRHGNLSWYGELATPNWRGLGLKVRACVRACCAGIWCEDKHESMTKPRFDRHTGPATSNTFLPEMEGSRGLISLIDPLSWLRNLQHTSIDTDQQPTDARTDVRLLMPVCNIPYLSSEQRKRALLGTSERAEPARRSRKAKRGNTRLIYARCRREVLHELLFVTITEIASLT